MSKENQIQWWVNAAYTVHHDMRGHMGQMMSMGKDAMYSASGKEKWKTQSLTEAELVGVHTNYPFDFLQERSHQPIEHMTKI